MELSNLRPAEGAVKSEKRIGRGQGSGRGGTSTKGHKGAKSRAGFNSKRHFEGGQTPMQRRLPKRGFKNINREEFAPINLANLQILVDKFGTTTIDTATLVTYGVAKKSDKIKILGNGILTAKIDIKAHAASASAKAAIEALGGTVSII